VGKPRKVVKEERQFCADALSATGSILREQIEASGSVGRFATPPLGIVSFLLTPQERRRRIPATFSAGFWSGGPERKKWRVNPEGEKECSICRDGLCNALIRSVRLAATGCGPPTPEENSAAIAALRSAMFHRR
jgi:hypothetical protein